MDAQFIVTVVFSRKNYFVRKCFLLLSNLQMFDNYLGNVWNKVRFVFFNLNDEKESLLPSFFWEM